MRTIPITLAIIVLCLAGTPAAQAQFKPGYIYVSGSVGGEGGCDWGYWEGILKVDLVTGEVTTFADCSDGINWPSGLRFTPDRTRLLAIMTGTPYDPGWMQVFNPDGTSEIILDESDGLVRPRGSNGLAFDRAGNLYVVDRVRDVILRFPAEGGPATVFADANDGINDSGALDFAPNGDLFYTATIVDKIIRITPQGESSVFDSFDPLHRASTLAFDRMGNLFVGATPVEDVTVIYRYDNADPKTRRVLAKGIVPQVNVIAFAPDDDSVLYVATGANAPSTLLYAVDPVDGSATPIAQLPPDVESIGPTGMAVFPLTVAGDMDGDLDVDRDDFAIFLDCVTGPGGGQLPPECLSADFDVDDDIDFHDAGLLLLKFTGNCGVTVTQQPQDATVCPGASAMFLVEADGVDLSYQWLHDGEFIPGANDPILEIEPVTQDDLGIYLAEVIGGCAARSSERARLATFDPLVVLAHPEDVIACCGEAVEFRIMADGFAPLSFQWQRDGVEIPGATEATYSIASIGPEDFGSYRCIVTDGCGQDTPSEEAQLTSEPPPVVLAQPDDITACLGESAEFGIMADGCPPLSFLWQRDGVDIPGATESTYTIASIEPEDFGFYLCVVTDGCGQDTPSDEAQLTSHPETEIVDQPVGGAPCVGEEFFVFVIAGGAESFQWYKDAVAIKGETEFFLQITDAMPEDSGVYFVDVIGPCVTLRSDDAVVNVINCPP